MDLAIQRITNNIQRFTREQSLFYVAFALCAFTTLMVRTTFSSVLGIPKDLFVLLGYVMSALFLLIKIFFEREASWRFAFAVVLIVLAFVSFWVADVWRFSVIFLFIAAGKNISLRWLAFIALVVQVAVLIPTLCFAVPGYIHSFSVYRLVDGTWMPRSSFGYSHPNMLGQVFVVIAASFAVLRFPRFHIADLLVYTAAGLAAALLVWSRTATVAIVLVAILAALAPRIVQHRQTMHVAAVSALAIFCSLALFSFLMMATYNPEITWMNTVDTLLSQRFTMAHRFFEVFSPTAFGRELMAVKVDDFLQDAPDNAYVRMLVKQGIIPTVVLGVLIFMALLRNARFATWDACSAGLLVYAFVGLMEMFAINFTLNYFLIACAWVLYGAWDETDVFFLSEDLPSERVRE